MVGIVKRVLIIGCNGGFGQLLSRQFADEGFGVGGMDLAASGGPGVRVGEYLSCDVTKLTADAARFIGGFQWIVLCVPESPAVSSLQGVIASAMPGALVVDILSVKTSIVATAQRHTRACEYLSIHPLFAPDNSMRGNISIIPVTPGPESSAFRDMLIRWGGNPIQTTADEHDRTMAMVQVITHAAILAFAATTSCSELLGSAIHGSGTPVQQGLAALAARVSSGDPALYWDIQKNNPYADTARQRLSQALEELRGMVERGDFDKFAAFYRDARRAFE